MGNGNEALGRGPLWTDIAFLLVQYAVKKTISGTVRLPRFGLGLGQP